MEISVLIFAYLLQLAHRVPLSLGEIKRQRLETVPVTLQKKEMILDPGKATERWGVRYHKEIWLCSKRKGWATT